MGENEFGYCRVGFCIEIYVTNLVMEVLASSHVVRRVGSNSCALIGIAAAQQHLYE